MKPAAKKIEKGPGAAKSARDEAVALVTGFDAFGGDRLNPSQEIAHALDGAIIAGHRIVGATLPTEFARALPALDALLVRHKPALVLALGLAGGRSELALERVAVNLIDARIADNAGAADELERRLHLQMVYQEEHAARKALLDRRPGLVHHATRVRAGASCMCRPCQNRPRVCPAHRAWRSRR